MPWWKNLIDEIIAAELPSRLSTFYRTFVGLWRGSAMQFHRAPPRPTPRQGLHKELHRGA
jgi:hypothetical protein